MTQLHITKAQNKCETTKLGLNIMYKNYSAQKKKPIDLKYLNIYLT